jgi:type IV secretory pathway TraG/TraD family ATPase VirD4
MATDHLTPTEALTLFRRYRKNTNAIVRGNVVRLSLNNANTNIGYILALTLIVGTPLFAVLVFFGLQYGVIHTAPFLYDKLLSAVSELANLNRFFKMLIFSILYGFQLAVLLALFIAFLPVLSLLLRWLFRWQRPLREQLYAFSLPHRLLAFGVLAFLLSALLHPLFGGRWLFSLWPSQNWIDNIGLSWFDFYLSTNFLLTWAIIWVVTFVGTPFCLPKAGQRRFLDKAKAAFSSADDTFSLYLGESTGKLIARNHEAGMKSGQRVCLSGEQASRNLLIFGGIGEGKTAAMLSAILLQLLDQDCGGLIFDVKGNFKHIVQKLAAVTGRNITVISVTAAKTNLLAGLSPEVAASFLCSLYIMTSESHSTPFWTTQANNLTRGALGVLSFIPAHYTLEGLRCFLFDEPFREDIESQVNTLELDSRAQSLLKGYRSMLDMFDKQNEKTYNDVLATIASTLNHVMHPDIIENFCCTDSNEALPFEQVLDGTIFLVDMPEAIYAGSYRIIHTLIKLRWFYVMQARSAHPEWNQTRYVFFMCDEYQKLMTASSTEGSVSDLTFWDKSRESRAIGIISAQGVSSLYASIRNHDLANAIVQNFRQKLCFKTEDLKTLDYIQRITGSAEIDVVGHSKQTSTSTVEGRQHRTTSHSKQLSKREQKVIDTQLIRSLKANQAVALLSFEQESMDDVLNCKPVFVN